MEYLRDRIIALGRPMLLLLVLCLGACSDLGPGGGKGNIIALTNSGNKPLLINVIELETSARIEFISTLPVTPGQRGLVEPHETVWLTGRDITGGYRRGDGVNVFVYDVTDNVAQLRGGVQFTAAQLRQQRFRVHVSN